MQGTSNGVLAPPDALTGSFPQPSAVLGNTSLSLFLWLGLIPTARLQPDAYPDRLRPFSMEAEFL